MTGVDAFPLPASMSVPDFGGRLLGLGRDASYDAADRGEIPVVRIGRSLRVSTYAGLRKLGWPDDLIAQALGITPALPQPNGEAATASPSASVHALATSSTGGPQHDLPPAR